MTDLCVDYATLERGAAKLAGLKRAFNDLPHTVAEQSSDWGSRDIAGAMQDFGTNWDYRRGTLTEQIDTVGQKIEGSVQAFREADAKLAQEADRKGS